MINKKGQPKGRENPTLVKNKRGQLCSTVTWMVAFTIIFFIMLLYLVGVGALAGSGKAFKFKDYEGDSNVDSLMGQRKLIVLLNSEIEFLGEDITIREAVVKSMSVYTQDDVFLELNIDNLDKLKQVSWLSRREALENSFVDRQKVDEVQNEMGEQENFLRSILIQRLKDECYSYFFRCPLFEGVVLSGGIGGSYYDYLDRVRTKDILKSVMNFNENGKTFSVELYSSKHIGGKCNEK